MTLSSSGARSGTISRREGGSAYWMARMLCSSCASGRWKGVAAADHLVEDEPDGEDVGLDAGLAGDELLRRHVGDGAATRGVGGPGECGRHVLHGERGVEVDVLALELAGEAKVEDLDEAAVGEHDVGGLEVAMEDAQVVRGGETVGDLHAAR